MALISEILTAVSLPFHIWWSPGWLINLQLDAAKERGKKLTVEELIRAEVSPLQDLPPDFRSSRVLTVTKLQIRRIQTDSCRDSKSPYPS